LEEGESSEVAGPSNIQEAFGNEDNNLRIKVRELRGPLIVGNRGD
jgi:hypothetical protein